MSLTGQKREHGSALLVALVLIFMMSIMGIMTMRGSTLEHRMATNSIQAATTLQAAESATDLVINDQTSILAAVEANGTAVAQDVSELETLVDGLQSSADIRYLGQGIAPGFSINNFRAMRFEVEGVADIEAVRSGARVRQGGYRVTPVAGSD